MGSSSTSSSRPFPRALALAAGLILAGEIAIGAALPVNQGRTRVDDLLAELESHQPYKPVVLWADSVTAGAVQDAGGDPSVADLSSTQAISMAGVYFTYRRYVETAGAPKAFVLSMIPESFGNDLDQVFTPTYFESAFLRWEEIGSLAGETGRYGQALRMAGYKVLHPPSMLRRAAVRLALQRLRSPGGRKRGNLPLSRIVGTDHGVTEALAKRALQERFVLSPVSRAYLEIMARETAATGTRLVLITPAVPRSVAEGWTRTGYLREYEAALAESIRRHPHVSIEPVLRFADYEDMQMYDTVHLRPEPARAYGERVLNRVRSLAR